MALEELSRNIEHDAKLAASKMNAEGESAAKAILDEATHKAGAARKMAKADAHEEVEQRKRDMLIALEIEAGNILSMAKEECTDTELRQLVAAVKKRLQAREQEVIKSALKNFSTIVPLKDSMARVSKRNANIVRSSVAKIVPEELQGVILSSTDGRVSVDASVDGLVGSNAETIRRVLSKELFE